MQTRTPLNAAKQPVAGAPRQASGLGPAGQPCSSRGQPAASARLDRTVHRCSPWPTAQALGVLLTADGTPKIADFGLARHFDGGPALTLSDTPMGTPSYMAPEQFIGKAGTIRPAADIYALGVLLYEQGQGQ